MHGQSYVARIIDAVANLQSVPGLNTRSLKRRRALLVERRKRGETTGADRREFSRGPLAVPATGLRSGRVAVVEGGAEAEVEAL